MLKAGLIGIGSMGRGHLDNYINMLDDPNAPFKLVAICDIDESKFTNFESKLNIKGMGDKEYDFSLFNCYTDLDEMLAKEELDMVSIVVPTYLHCWATLKCLEKGINVLCEKPMGLNADECQTMIDAAKKADKHLMIGQVLRFWGEYEVLKKYVDSEKLGKCYGGYFFRGGSTPMWSFNNWLLKKECGGGALFDQHVHDTDMINYLFGMPKAVTSSGVHHYEGSGYDFVSTNYIYDGMAVNAQDDWFMAGAEFQMTFRVNFEKGTITMDHKGFKIIDRDGNEIKEEIDSTNGYLKETIYFANMIINNSENKINPPTDSMNTIKIATAESLSCDQGGKIIEL